MLERDNGDIRIAYLGSDQIWKTSRWGVSRCRFVRGVGFLIGLARKHRVLRVSGQEAIPSVESGIIVRTGRGWEVRTSVVWRSWVILVATVVRWSRGGSVRGVNCEVPGDERFMTDNAVHSAGHT